MNANVCRAFRVRREGKHSDVMYLEQIQVLW